MAIESVPVTLLSSDPANARKHSPKNLDAIKGSLRRFGQQKPIVVTDKGVVVAGNGTLEAAKSLGWTEIQVVKTSLTGTDLTAFAIADNRTGELAEWDAGVLSDTLKSLKDMDFDLGDIGFDEKDLAGLIAEPIAEGLTDPDEVPADVDTRCKPGDLWVLGNHRLLCGDSTNVQHVERLMGGEKADMVFTSPPYADLRDYGGGLDLDPKKLASALFDFSAKTYYVNIGLMIKNREIVDIWSAYLEEAKNRGLKLLAWNVWDKENASAPAHQQAMFGLCHEWVFVFGEYRQLNLTNKNKMTGEVGYSATSGTRERDGSITKHTKKPIRECRQLDSVITLQRQNNQASDFWNHPAQYPVALPEEFINAASDSGNLIAEPFSGSGSTLIACEKTNRKCYGMEIDPKYCSVILERWERFTGKKAELVGE